MRRGMFVQAVTWYMVAVMIVFGFVPRVEAGFIASQASPASQNRIEDLGSIQKSLEMRMVSETLEKFGMTKAEVKSRLDGMTDAQIHQLATNLDEVRVAGDSGLGIVVALLIIAILVIVIIQLTGHRVIVQ
ncbi:MAG TPA: PA2779 family protein [Nitrospirota bacterium]|nr:PA2779 family protein [Nitrospirota bacterium]